MRSSAEIRRVLHLGVPPRREALKETLRSAMPIGGAQVAESTLAQAFIRHCPLDEICFIPTTAEPLEELRVRLSQYAGSPRCRVVLPEEASSLPGRSVIFQNSPRIQEAAGLRSLAGAPSWPIVGITHSLSVSDGLMSAMFTTRPGGYLKPYDRIVCTSQAGERAYREMMRQVSCQGEPAGEPSPARNLTTVIPLGVDPEHFTPARGARPGLGIAEDDIVFLYFGRFSVEFKMDPFPLLAAFAMAFRDAPGVKLILAGDTAAGGQARIPEIASGLGIAGQVRVIGDPSAAVKLGLYQAADVFVSFSDNLQETFGLTILEAMSCGLPVVATDWSGYRETVLAGQTGLLVPTTWRFADSSVSRLAPFYSEAATHLRFAQEVSFDLGTAVRYLRQLAGDPDLRRRLGANARRRAADHYAWPVIARAYGRLFAQLLDEAAADRSSGTANGYPPFSYDRPAAFRHFATEAGGLPGLVRGQADEPVSQVAVQLIAPSAAQAVIAACRPGEIRPTEDLVRELTEILGGHRAAIQAVVLLLKYGVIA